MLLCLVAWWDRRYCTSLRWCGSLDYRHMCYFFDELIFKSPELKQFDYVWRMDSNLALSKCGGGTKAVRGSDDGVQYTGMAQGTGEL